jgi:hypothetical protein
MVRGGGNAFAGFMVWGDQTLYRDDSLPPGQYLTMVESENPEPPTYDVDRHVYALAARLVPAVNNLCFFGLCLAIAQFAPVFYFPAMVFFAVAARQSRLAMIR